MKLCHTCGQSVAEEINTCPSCGAEIGEGRTHIDDYRIEEVLHEGHASILCRAIKEGEKRPVMIRLFTPQSAVNEEVANRLKRELEEIRKLPTETFVSHQEIRRSSDGLWYRISEWVDAESWGELVRSGQLEDYRVTFDLFSKIASALEVLHQAGHFIPHLVLNDIMVVRGERGELEVKIDYKLSRFLDPKLDRPPPMLKRLLACHPDIINERPLDFRSDIWSLGKVFIELLTADYETCDFLARVDALPLPNEIRVLFKTMLSDDPALRPRSMEEVAEILARVTDEEIEKAKRRQLEQAAASAEAISRLGRWYKLFWGGLAALILVVGSIWFQSTFQKREAADVMEEYANRCASSIAFVLVEYWIQEDKTIAYRSQAEGTAFLVDSDGYLLTNRHVACPWLEDKTLQAVIEQLKARGRSANFGYRMFLWFDGAKAFNRSAGLMESPNLADLYFLDSAFRTDGTPRLTIAGVAKPPSTMRQLVLSPLRDDFAVLRIDRVPEGLRPLLLDPQREARKIPRLERVIILGFPLGSRIQETTVNVSVTRGNVRRSFGDLIQVDASLYGGNSGGPMIDVQGKVIGIASGVATDRAQGFVPMVTPLWDMAMVLPITKAAAFLQDIKAGCLKWNGVLDLSVQAKLKRIMEMAAGGRWADALSMADRELELSSDPSLVMAAAVMHFCVEDYQGATRLLGRAVSMDAENVVAKLLMFIIDWQAGRSSSSQHREELLALDWRSPAEFSGYLARILEGLVEPDRALNAWDTQAEKSWLYYVIALIREKRGELTDAEILLREAVLTADMDAWELFVALARLKQVQKRRLESYQQDTRWAEYQRDIEAFDRTAQGDRAVREDVRVRLAALQAEYGRDFASSQEKQGILEKMLEISPGNGEILAALAFYTAANGGWPRSLEYARAFLTRDGRENARRLSLGLLEAEVLRCLRRQEEAVASLEAYVHRTRDPWHRAISEGLLGKRTPEALRKEAVERPENVITLYTALGLWAEGSGDKKMAVAHYKEAMVSFLDTWPQFTLARERIKALRRSSG